MARSNFGTGSPITSTFLNKVARPQISALDEDGHIPLLDNTSFLNQSGVVSYDFYNLVDRLQSHQAVGGGLNLYVHGVTIQKPDGLPVAIPATTLTLPDNQVSFVYADPTGFKVSSTNPPSGVRSARVTTGSGQITNVEDLRYDYLWIPNVQGLAVFGGTSVTDITCTNGQVIRGTVECRDFTVPLGVTVSIDREVVIRASRDVTILGTVNTLSNPTPFGANTSGLTGVSTGANTTFLVGSEYPIPTGSGSNPFAARNQSWRGVFLIEIRGVTVASNASVFCNYSSAPGNGLNIVAGTSGALLTINAAGALTVGSAAVIQCSATNTTTLTALSNLALISSHPTSGLAPTTWSVITSFSAPQSVAGRCIFQSLQRIDVASGAQIRVKGADRGLANTITWTQAGGSATVNYLLPGAGGGGSIHFQSPILNVSPSATLDVAAGNQPVTPVNERFDGIGCSGNGYIAATNTAPTAGVVTSSTEVPRER
jgi:hypothetical protein